MLVVLEGIDGAGKSSIARGLAEKLTSEGISVVLTKEPTEGPIGQKLRGLTAEQRAVLAPEQELAMFEADRAQHVAEVVRPALQAGKTVIQDRSYFSTVAYQSERGLSAEDILLRSQRIAPEPDLLLVVDIPVELAVERITQTRPGGLDGFEAPSVLRRLRQRFLSFEGASVLDGSQPLDTLIQRAYQAVKDFKPTDSPSTP